MGRSALVLCAAVALSGCLGDADKAAQPPPTAIVAPPPVVKPVEQVCIPFRPWSDADLKALAAELAPVPAESLTIRMALDWHRYYGDAKACAAAQGKG